MACIYKVTLLKCYRCLDIDFRYHNSFQQWSDNGKRFLFSKEIVGRRILLLEILFEIITFGT